MCRFIYYFWLKYALVVDKVVGVCRWFVSTCADCNSSSVVEVGKKLMKALQLPTTNQSKQTFNNIWLSDLGPFSSPRHKADHSPPTIAKLKNGWSYLPFVYCCYPLSCLGHNGTVSNNYSNISNTSMKYYNLQSPLYTQEPYTLHHNKHDRLSYHTAAAHSCH